MVSDGDDSDSSEEKPAVRSANKKVADNVGGGDDSDDADDEVTAVEGVSLRAVGPTSGLSAGSPLTLPWIESVELERRFNYNLIECVRPVRLKTT